MSGPDHQPQPQPQPPQPQTFTLVDEVMDCVLAGLDTISQHPGAPTNEWFGLLERGDVPDLTSPECSNSVVLRVGTEYFLIVAAKVRADSPEVALATSIRDEEQRHLGLDGPAR